MSNSHQDYINKTVDGGIDAYVANQQARYEEAVKNNDTSLMGRLAADAIRVGYDLADQTTRVGGGGTASTGGAGRGGYTDSFGTYIPSSTTLGVDYTGGNAAGIVGQLGSNIGGMIPIVAVVFFLLLIFRRR